MPFFTSHGLKLRFDPEALEPVVWPLMAAGAYENLMLDLQLWVALSGNVAMISGLVTAHYTHSWLLAILASIGGYILGHFITELGYSDWIRRIVTNLGNWMVSLVVTIVLGTIAIRSGDVGTAILFAGIWFINWCGVLVLVTLPVTFFIGLWAARQTKMVHADRIFIMLCNQRAAKLGLKLDWNLYFDRMEELAASS